MPPGSEAFIDGVLKALLSQYGALFGAMTVAIWYLVKQLAEERKSHTDTSNKLIELTERSVETSVVTSEALGGLRTLVERMVYDKAGRTP